jgi:protein-L-isoaspartate(D-aspartate) O-methyltransferase
MVGLFRRILGGAGKDDGAGAEEALPTEPLGDNGEERMGFLLGLRRRGIGSADVLRALDDVPREKFVEADFTEAAYADQALPIACGQTISQPFVVAYMTEQLDVHPGHRVLEIGTGSGYQAAVLAKLARRVYTVERYKPLSKEAERLLIELRIHNAVFDVGDGSKGWPGQAPFDRIIVTAAADERPQALIDQLALGGILIVPVGRDPTAQVVERIVKSESGLQRDTLMPVRFVPLVTGALPVLGQG